MTAFVDKHKGYLNVPIMTEPKTGLFILSLCSERLKNYLSTKDALSFMERLESCTFIYMHEYEINNLLFFQRMHYLDASSELERSIAFFSSVINQNTVPDVKTSFLSYNDIKQQIVPVQQKLEQEYACRGSFFRAVNNQVYQNLHPKLKRMGIKNSRHPAITKLTPFLLAELAILIAYTIDGSHNTLLSTCRPMQVFEDLRNGKFGTDTVNPIPQLHFQHILA